MNNQIVSLSRRLADTYRDRPLADLVEDIEQQLEDGMDSDAEIFLVLSESGESLAGNLPRWQGRITPHDELLTDTLPRSGEASAEESGVTLDMDEPEMLVVQGDRDLIASAVASLIDNALSSQGMPHIPEPLVFDLVRPLGAKRGELEINMLTQHNRRTCRNEWAPEIEYAFADGLAIELELPFDGNWLEEYKVALQVTLGTLRNDTMVHGWQLIGYRNRHDGHYAAHALYINGQELGGPTYWSLDWRLIRTF